MKFIIKALFFLFSSVFFLGCSSKNDFIEEENENSIPEVIEDYEPGDASKIEKDIKIPVKSAKASEHQNGTPIELSIDDDYSTQYHSLWNSTKFPVTLEYTFSEEAETIDYVILRPRQSGPNGIFLKITVQTRSVGESEFTEFGDFEFEQSNTPQMIIFPEGFEKPAAFKITVTDGAGGFASLAEIEFFHRAASIQADLEVFKDKACTELKSGVTRDELSSLENEFIRTMALAIYDGSYDEFRIGTFKSYPRPEIISQTNKTSTYGIYDNVTGIYFPRNSEMVVFMGDFEGKISLRVVNHKIGFGGTDYLLQPGMNRFKTNTDEGLAYLIYQDDHEYEVKANFATGTVNGYFDIKKHTNADWNDLLANAQYSFFDVLGNYAHLTFTTNAFQNYTKDPTALIELYDEIVDLEQDFMGLYKYDRANKTRMYFRANIHQDMYMFATSYRTEYSEGTLSSIANAESLRKSPWGPAHEVGHINQTRPGMKWLGLTEVTNNIYSLYVQKALGNGARIDEEDLGSYNNRYEKGFTEILATNLAHVSHDDVFVKLIPFWQLQLYLADIRGYDDFYKDVHEVIRTSEDQRTNGASQVEFVKICSDVAQMDLTDFFAAWGYLTPVNTDINDYGNGNLTVTENMVAEVRSYISSKGYPKPDAHFRYITDSNLDVFQSMASVVPGTASVSGGEVNINGSQYAAVYQQERDGKIIFISPKMSFTVPSFSDSDKLFAVGANGDREEIFVN